MRSIRLAGESLNRHSASTYRVFFVTLLAASAVTLGADDVSVVTGTVMHPSVGTHTTVVYIDAAGGKFDLPAAQPTLELNRNGFTRAVLPVMIGTTVRIKDSHAKNAEAVAKTFDESGAFVQLCSKHPEHVAHVLVLDTPYFAVADSDGRFQIDGVPSGKQKLRVWNQELAPNQIQHTHEVTVTAGGSTRTEVTVPPLTAVGKFWLEPPPRSTASLVEHGSWIYRQRGCFLCHGENGAGGVRNPNYIKETIPALNTIAEKLLLFDEEDVRSIIAHIERGRNLEALKDDPPLARYDAFLAQYSSVRDVITKGNPAGKLHPKGPKPPLDMPHNKDLSKTDVDALIAYLLTLQGSEQKP